jgi:hypothetical protein
VWTVPQHNALRLNLKGLLRLRRRDQRSGDNHRRARSEGGDFGEVLQLVAVHDLQRLKKRSVMQHNKSDVLGIADAADPSPDLHRFSDDTDRGRLYFSYCRQMFHSMFLHASCHPSCVHPPSCVISRFSCNNSGKYLPTLPNCARNHSFRSRSFLCLRVIIPQIVKDVIPDDQNGLRLGEFRDHRIPAADLVADACRRTAAVIENRVVSPTAC